MTTYFRTILVIEVLSEREAFNGDFEELAEATQTGDCVGSTKMRAVEQCSASEIAALLTEAGSTPGFFSLDEAGKPLED